MKILEFEFHDNVRGWTLEPMRLDAFNLLVGVSGAGKTRIVRAIEQVCSVALGTRETEKIAEAARGSRFAIEIEHDGLHVKWAAELEPPSLSGVQENGSRAQADEPLIRAERITQGDRVLVDRSAEQFLLNGVPIPRLDRAKSAIAMLKEDPSLAPLYEAFSRCIFRQLELLLTHGGTTSDLFDQDRARYRSPEDLGADLDIPLHYKAELLQDAFPDAFAKIEDSFRDAFPSVDELRVHRLQHWELPQRRDLYTMALTIKEAGVDSPVHYRDMSSGMQRYLSFLIHLSFAPPGTVVLIDELESSMGVNCLPAVTRFLLSRAPDLQFILTSHHPYIIEQIPPTDWKIVTRRGSRVRVLDASQIPALGEGRSHLDRFTRLINLPEYEQGIQA